MVLLAACLVGVGEYTAQLRYSILTYTLLLAVYLLCSWLAGVLRGGIINWSRSRLRNRDIEWTRSGRFVLRNFTHLVQFMIFVLLFFGALALVVPLIGWFAEITAYRAP